MVWLLYLNQMIGREIILAILSFAIGLSHAKVLTDYRAKGHDNERYLHEMKFDHADINTNIDVDQHPDFDLNTPQMIARRGYPTEVHHVTTTDNYVLEMHRIPNHGKQVVFLQHGILGSSSDFVVLGPELGLAYIMYDAGYDVWMGNARGNTYSRNHTFLNPDSDSEFWQFSWHQMGIYDSPAQIDYVLEHTSVGQVTYVGHSMGTTMFWVMCSRVLSYNKKIKQMHALAPVAFMGNVRSPLRLFAPFVNQIGWILSAVFGVNEFLPNKQLFDYLGQKFCNDDSMFQIVCSNILFLVAGYDSQQLNETTLPVIISHAPAGSSTKALVHYAQEITSKSFEMYNFGYFGNKNVYGQHNPPDYDISKITVPVYLHYSDNDWMAHPEDVDKLYSQLPNGKGRILVPFEKFTHLDFLWATNVRNLVYDTLLALIANPLP